MHVDYAQCWIWQRSVSSQSTLTVVDRSYTNFREFTKGEVRRILLPYPLMNNPTTHLVAYYLYAQISPLWGVRSRRRLGL